MQQCMVRLTVMLFGRVDDSEEGPCPVKTFLISTHNIVFGRIQIDLVCHSSLSSAAL